MNNSQILLACDKLHLRSPKPVTFGNMNLLFSQRINTVVSLGLMPPAHYDNFEGVFQHEEYTEEKLVMGCTMYMQRCQQILEELKKQTTVASTLLMEEQLKNYQRVGMGNGFDG